MNTSFEVDVRNFQRAAAKFAVLKNKSDADVVNKAMKYWLPFAAARVKKETKGPPKIVSDLRAVPRNPIGRKFKRGKDHWGGTLGAALVAARLKKRGALNKASTPGGRFWELVENLKDAKIRSLNFLRAGFIPAYRAFNIPNKVGNHRRFKGRSVGFLAVPSLTGAIEAFARNAREGAYKLTPNAFRDALPEVARQFIKWMDQDTVQQGRKSGFY